jgi:hypothetical protein
LFLGGVIAGEGSFLTTTIRATYADGSPRVRFRFQMTLATRDRGILEALQDCLGCGSIRDVPARKARWQPASTFTINSHVAHRRATIPFCETFLLPSNKRQQFERWVADLDAYERRHPSRWGQGPTTCAIDGCGRPVRGRGLCRIHYYRVTGY